MLKRFVPWLAVMFLVAAPVAVRAADPQAATPDVVVRLQSVDHLLGHAKHIAKLADQEDMMKQFEDMLKDRTGSKGLAGLDTKRPLGMYASIAAQPEQSTGVVLIPVSDQEAFLGLLANLNYKAQKGKDDVYSIKTADLPVVIYLRFANKYAYFSPDATGAGVPAALDPAKLLDPKQVLTLDPTTVVSASVRIDKIPDNLKQIGIQMLELILANEKDKEYPGNTEAQHKVKGALLDAVGNEVVALVKEGGELAAQVNIDAKSNDLTVELSLTGKTGSKLATRIAKQADEKSAFGGLAGRDSALNMLIHGFYPEGVSKAFGPSLLEEMRKDVEKEKDAAKREPAAKLLKALEPELKSLGDWDWGFDLRGPSANKLYTVVGGQKVKDGKALEKGLQDVVKSLPREAQDNIKIDAEKAGNVSIHRIDVQKGGDAEFRRLFGDNPAYVAFRSDVVMSALGDKGLDALKEALAAQPREGPTVRVDASMTRLALLSTRTSKVSPRRLWMPWPRRRTVTRFT